MSKNWNGLLVPALVALLLTGFAIGQEDVATVNVASHPEYGSYLVDGDGMSLYLFTRDEDGTSTCYEQCAQAWPPVLVEGVVAFGDEVDLGLLGTTGRDDGSHQLTYGGWPLYGFASDEAAGDVDGQGVNEVWYLVTPDAEAVEATGSAQSAATSVDAEVMSAGADVFANVCAECHGAEGSGGFGPSLAGRESLDDAVDIASKLINGFGYMPPVGAELTNEQLAAVLTFVRSSWGNEFGPTSPEEVASAR